MSDATSPDSLDKQFSPCVACGGDTWTIICTGLADYLTGEMFSIASCNDCQLQMTQPLPVGEAIGHYYPTRYRGNRHSFTGDMRCFLRRVAIEKCFERGFKGRLLDIGCGDGSFALHMKARGWQVAATELDQAVVERLRECGIDARISSPTNLGQFDDSFDAITNWHVLEHIEHPKEIATAARLLLKPSGVFQATVPNVGCLQAKVFGRNWFHLDVPRHRQHFTVKTLRAMLQSAGFIVEHQANFALEYDWLGIIQSALNSICTSQNVLFDMLIASQGGAAEGVSTVDKYISWVLMPPIAALSFPIMLGAALVGDGATLTLTCKAAC